MTAGKSGYLEFTPSVLWAAVRVYYEEDYDALSNTSRLTVTSIQVKSTSHYNATYYIDGALMLGGTQALTCKSSTGNVSVHVDSRDTWYPIEKDGQTLTVTLEGIVHDESGSAAIDVELTGNRFQRFAFYTVDGEDGNGWGVKQTQSLPLTDIPRASAIAATDASVGAVSTVTVTRRNSAYSHAVAFSFGEVSGWLDADGSVLDTEKKLTAATIPFTLPESFYAQLTDAPSGLCLLACTTYLGDTRIGQTQQTSFRVTAREEACAPEVSGTVEDINPVTAALTGDSKKLVRYASTALCAISARGRQGASIVQKTIAGTAVTENSRTIEKIEQNTVEFGATDSRGYCATALVTAQMIPYIPLTLHAQAKRTDPTGGQVLLTLRGNYYAGSFGASDNTLTLSYSVAGKSGQLEAVVEDDTYTASAVLTDLDYRSSHTITVTAQDKIHTRTATAPVGKGIPVFDWGEADFAFHVPVELEQGATVGGKTLADLLYPVGTVHISANETDPAAQFGGAWTPLENPLGLSMWKRTA